MSNYLLGFLQNFQTRSNRLQIVLNVWSEKKKKKIAFYTETDVKKMISGDTVTNKSQVSHKEFFWKGNRIFFF